jgi:hypothetical protein
MPGQERSGVPFDIVVRKGFVLPQEFSGIEDVLVPSKGGDRVDIVDGGEMNLSEITEVAVPSRGHDVTHGGLIFMRERITTTVLSIWVVWTLVGLLVFLLTGNAIILVTSPVS